MHEPAAARAEDRPHPVDLARALAGWLLAGAIAGAVVGALSVRGNTSLQGPDQAAPFVELTTLTYAALFLPFGFVAALIARFAAKVRPSAGASVLAALVGFAVYAVCQKFVGAVRWHEEGNAVNLAISVTVAFVAATIARVVLGRADHLRKARRIAAAVIALAAAGFAIASIQRDARVDADAPKEASEKVEPARTADGKLPRVMLIGVDGADWERIDPLLAAGRLPNFARLCDGAFRAPLTTTQPTWSPIVWTTIACGVREETHGVLDFTEVQLPWLGRGVQRTYPKYKYDALLPNDVGLVPMFESLVEGQRVDELPVSSLQRNHKAVWNILSEHGVKCGVVRWWATWPAEQIEGYVLSDNDPLMQVFAASKRENMKGQFTAANATTAYMTWPPELAGDLVPLIHADGQLLASRPDGYEKLLEHPILRDLTPAERTELRGREPMLEMLEIIVRGDNFANRTGLELWNGRKVDMLAVYLRSVDNMSHRLAQFTGVVDRTYEFADGLIGELLDAGGADTTYVLVSDHGWCYVPGPNFAHNHGPPGVIVVKGPGVVAGATAAPSVVDVAPTVLALYGLPADRDMVGKPLTPVFTQPSIAAKELPRIATYGAYRPIWPISKRGSSAGQKQAIDLLRGLGYLGNADAAADGKSKPKPKQP